MKTVQKLGLPVLFFYNNCCTGLIKIIEGKVIKFGITKNGELVIFLNTKRCT